MRLFSRALIGLLISAHPGLAQSAEQIPGKPTTNPPACHAESLEIVDEGGDAGLGHSVGYIGLRNISAHACVLSGIPRLRFLDGAGKQIVIPYASNADGYMAPKQPEKPVSLTPGGFAYFEIQTATGDQSLHFASLRVLLPGDNTPLFAGNYGQGGGLDSINVSAIAAGVPDGFTAPTQQIDISAKNTTLRRSLKQNVPPACPWCSVPATGPIPGLIVALQAPPHPQWGSAVNAQSFPLHFAVKNASAEPIALNSRNCTVRAELTNSAGKTFTGSAPCPAWEGETDEQGQLLPGALMTSDFDALDGWGDLGILDVCRVGTWQARLSLDTPWGALAFKPVSFDVDAGSCSDSAPSGATERDATDVRWTYFSSCGVRLGVVLFTNQDKPPATGKFFTGTSVPMFTAGQPVGLKLFLDNLTDAPLELASGPRAFRIVVRGAGRNVPAFAILAPKQSQTKKDSRQVTIPPHTWSYVQSVDLNDSYDLAPGDYEVRVGPLALSGTFGCANAAATGWPHTRTSVINTLLVGIGR